MPDCLPGDFGFFIGRFLFMLVCRWELNNTDYANSTSGQITMQI